MEMYESVKSKNETKVIRAPGGVPGRPGSLSLGVGICKHILVCICRSREESVRKPLEGKLNTVWTIDGVTLMLGRGSGRSEPLGRADVAIRSAGKLELCTSIAGNPSLVRTHSYQLANPRPETPPSEDPKAHIPSPHLHIIKTS